MSECTKRQGDPGPPGPLAPGSLRSEPHALRSVGLGAVIAVACVLAYSSALQGGFIWDDESYVTQNPKLGSLAGLGAIWSQVTEDYRHQYYPLTLTMFWVQHALWGLHPLGYHLTNVLLHAANAVLLWRLGVRLGVRGSWIAGAIFAVHPVYVQSVAWISELKNVLSGFFFLASLLAFLRFDETRPRDEGLAERSSGPGSPRVLGPDIRFYALGLVLFLAALLSKTATASLPIALGLGLWWKHGRLRWSDVLLLGPLVLVAATMIGGTMYLELEHGGAKTAVEPLGIWTRALVAGRSIWFYASTLLWPTSLSAIYPRWAVETWGLGQGLWLGGVVAVLAALRGLQYRWGRGPLAAALFFVLAVGPVSFASVAFMRLSLVADHWQYWGSMSLVLLGAAVGATLVARSPQPLLGPILAAFLIAGLGIATFRHAASYRDPIVFWENTVRKNSACWLAHHNLGVLLEQEGRPLDAITHLTIATNLRPQDPTAHTSLGIALARHGLTAHALAPLEQSLSLRPHDPATHYSLALALRAQGRPREAAAHFRRTLDLVPGHLQSLQALEALSVQCNGIVQVDPAVTDASQEP